MKVFQIVMQIQRFITTIPAQVERQEPVYLLDALGRTSLFHLEFVRSPEVSSSIRYYEISVLIMEGACGRFEGQFQEARERS